MGREEIREGDSESVRGEKKQREEMKWESLLWERQRCGRKYCFLGQKKIIFIRVMKAVQTQTMHKLYQYINNLLIMLK